LHWGSRNVPIQFWTSVERDLVVTKWWGDVTLDDFRDTFGMYLTDVNYTPGRTELNDFTGVSHFDADFPSIWSALTMVNNQVPGLIVETRTLLVAPSDHQFALTRIYQTVYRHAMARSGLLAQSRYAVSLPHRFGEVLRQGEAK
jgi:hypothetical protein